MNIVHATAPTRVDLAGGTLDLWPLSQIVEDAVTVNCALDIRTGCAIELGGSTWIFAPRDRAELELGELPRRPERAVAGTYQLAAVVAAHFALPPCRITTWSDAAPGSGLGGSSSLIIGLIAAAARIAGRTLGDPQSVELACNLETRVLGLPAGTQDHWAAQCGGLSILEHGAEGMRREAGHDAALGVAEALVIADTQVEHHSGMNNWSVLRAVLEGDPSARNALDGVARAAAGMRDALRSGATGDELLSAARHWLHEEWEARRRLAPAVSSPEVEAVVAAAESVGGAAKVCGAGGGGCVACLPAGAGMRGELELAIRATGARILPARPAPRGVETG